MKIALAQIDMFWEDKLKNKDKCLKFIEEASKNGAELIIFPEMTLTGFSMDIHKIGEQNNETVKWFLDKALVYNIYIGFGFVELENGFGKNNFSICSKEKKEIVRYTKIHPFSYGDEDKYYLKGNELKYFKIDKMKFSTFICYDLRFPEIFQAASKKSELIIIIANWPESRSEQWISLLKARAIENQCYVVAVNRVGIGNDIKYSGDSMVVNPYGDIICSCRNSEKLILCDLEIDRVLECRNKFRFKQDRREDLYCKFIKKELE
ncbi:nitrilase-related carbon-nitrogen hydrolase [Clostridium hydrogenum]|uniref:nitrilase-related carbon-nitrogen hydrolase n=1 Tax=Clostridium hydrogenum TaxID=2855764 RepID=UPI001F1DEAC6|nr:nitrilase-related carbon-nitrogen hydrolase [Clostridium hydrogenum]